MAGIENCTHPGIENGTVRVGAGEGGQVRTASPVAVEAGSVQGDHPEPEDSPTREATPPKIVEVERRPLAEYAKIAGGVS